MKIVLLESRNRSDRIQICIQIPDINKDILLHDTIRKSLGVVSNILWVYLKGIRRFENSIERCSNPYFPSCLHLVYQYWLTAKEEIRSLKSNFWTLQFELSKLSVFNNLHHSLCIFPIFFSMRCFLKSILNILHFLFIKRRNTIYLKNTVHISVYPATVKCLDEHRYQIMFRYRNFFCLYWWKSLYFIGVATNYDLTITFQ